MISSALGLSQLLALVGVFALARDLLLRVSAGWDFSALRLTSAPVPAGYRWDRFAVVCLCAAAHAGFVVAALGACFSVFFNLLRLAGLPLWI